MLIKSPIVFVAAFYVAVCYGILYLMFTTIPTVFYNTYKWNSSLAGLAYAPRTSLFFLLNIPYTYVRQV